MSKKYSIDQTNFIAEEPLLEDFDPFAEEKQQVKKKPNKVIVLSLVSVGVIVLMIVVLVVILSGSGGNGQFNATPTPQPTHTTQTQNEFTQRINQLQKELKDADPAKRSDPFPQVNMNIQ